MIAHLTGIVSTIGNNWVILDVNGIGYLVHCSSCSLHKISSCSTKKIQLEIETRLYHDRIDLFGFYDSMERKCFRILIGV